MCIVRGTSPCDRVKNWKLYGPQNKLDCPCNGPPPPPHECWKYLSRRVCAYLDSPAREGKVKRSTTTPPGWDVSQSTVPPPQFYVRPWGARKGGATLTDDLMLLSLQPCSILKFPFRYKDALGQITTTERDKYTAVSSLKLAEKERLSMVKSLWEEGLLDVQ